MAGETPPCSVNKKSQDWTKLQHRRNQPFHLGGSFSFRIDVFWAVNWPWPIDDNYYDLNDNQWQTIIFLGATATAMFILSLIMVDPTTIRVIKKSMIKF